MKQLHNYDRAMVEAHTKSMPETVRSSVVLAAPTALLLGSVIVNAPNRVLLTIVGALIWVTHAVCSLLSARAFRSNVSTEGPELARVVLMLCLTPCFVYLAHPMPGWIIALPGLAMLAAGLRGAPRVLTMAALCVVTCALIAALGVKTSTLLLCIACCASVGGVCLSNRQHLEAQEAKLSDVVAEVVRREREHGRAVMSAQRSSRLASVGQLAAGIAHEINNPLTYVISNLEYILEFEPKLARHLEAEDRHAIIDSGQDALEGAHRVRRIVHGIKLFARLDREVQVADVSVNEVLESSLDIARNEIRHRATLKTDFAEELPKVRADKGRLGQVFINLLINAAQAIPSESEDEHTITVGTVLDEEGFVAISIRDTGMGIASEKMSQIFEPFYTSKPVGEGTGLGLPIVHGIISDAGGHIDVASEVGKGTTFTVRLPISPDTTEELERTREYAAPKAERPSKILIIDDEPLVAKSLARMVKEAESTAVGGGDAALDVLREDADFDVVFCDLMMPGLSGPKFYEVLESEFPHLANRVIFITGGVFSDVTQSFLEQSQAHCLYKPFSIDSVRAAMRAVQTPASQASAQSTRASSKSSSSNSSSSTSAQSQSA